MTGQVLDIETICPKCDCEFTVTYVSHEAEAAEAALQDVMTRADTYAETIETLVNEKAQLEAERDEARKQLERAKDVLIASLPYLPISGDSYNRRLRAAFCFLASVCRWCEHGLQLFY